VQVFEPKKSLKKNTSQKLLPTKLHSDSLDSDVNEREHVHDSPNRGKRKPEDKPKQREVTRPVTFSKNDVESTPTDPGKDKNANNKR